MFQHIFFTGGLIPVLAGCIETGELVCPEAEDHPFSCAPATLLEHFECPWFSQGKGPRYIGQYLYHLA